MNATILFSIKGHLNQDVVNLLGSPSASGMSENDLLGAAEDLYCESFDAEAEATARLQVRNLFVTFLIIKDPKAVI